jgi:hypothetical protein
VTEVATEFEPAPNREITGEPATSVLMVTLPETLPAAAGLNTTVNTVD